MIGLYNIQKSIEDILVHSQAYPFELRADALTRQWYRAKQPFINMFGGNTMILCDYIKIESSKDHRSHEFDNFITLLIDNGLMTEDLMSFLVLNKEGFFDNKVICAYPSRNINLGSKLSKSLKKFIQEPDSKRWVQDAISRVIQESKIEGYLYLSVDPVDFLTLSENNSNWWSCHSLDGDYRAGNLSYMVDNTTIIAYLTDDCPQHFQALPSNMVWSSKKWRMLVHIGENCIYYNRQYPFNSDELLTKVSEQVVSFLDKEYGIPWEYGFRKIQTSDPGPEMLHYNQLYCGGRVFDTRDVIDSSDYFGYCDLITSPFYSPIVSPEINKHYLLQDKLRKSDSISIEEESTLFHDIYDIKIGERPICPCCGKELLDKKDSFLCSTCRARHDADEDFYISCSVCGHRIYDEDDIFWRDNRPYCKHCYHNEERI